jgi:hypothetical protein
MFFTRLALICSGVWKQNASKCGDFTGYTISHHLLTHWMLYLSLFLTMKSGISKQKLAVFVVPQTRAWAVSCDVVSTLSKLSWLLALCLFAQVCLKYRRVTSLAGQTVFQHTFRSWQSQWKILYNSERNGVLETTELRNYVLLKLHESRSD